MWKLFLLFFSLLAPQVDGDDADAGDAGEGDADDTGDDAEDSSGDDDAAEDDASGEDADPAPRESRAQREIRTLRERSQKAEADFARAQAELAEARRLPAGPAKETDEQRLWAQEDAVLRDPQADQWQKYAVQSARDARAARQSSQQAIQHAEELSDRSSFSQLAVTKPKLYSAYKDRVEDRLKEIRSRGGNAPREGVLAVIIGEDMLAGKLKSADARPAPKGGDHRTPASGARSGVSASGGKLTDSEKREKRLENVRI